MLLEWRALVEAGTLPLTWAALGRQTRGDGHPVLLLPGFMADEATLIALKAHLKRLGYAVQTWGLGRNIGFQPRHAEALERSVRHLHHISGRKVSLVGWSLGGLFALYAAHQATECVRQVVTLGSPLSIDLEQGHRSSALVRALYRLVAHPLGTDAHSMQPRLKKLRAQQLPALPLSCLYSEGDGVVPPQEATVDGDSSHCENVRIAGSHLGLAFNPLVLAIVANRLAQPEGGWQPFAPRGLSGALYRRLLHAPQPA